MALEADQDLPPPIKRLDLLLIHKTEGKLSSREGYMCYQLLAGSPSERFMVDLMGDSLLLVPAYQTKWMHLISVSSSLARSFGAGV